MKHYFHPIFALAICTILGSFSVIAAQQEKTVIALKTNNFELPETDISALAIGEAQTIETESGKLIDILRTVDGAEIYVDGELLEMNFDDEVLHEEHTLHAQHMLETQVEIVCDSDEDCDENIIVLTDDDQASDRVTLDGEEHKIIIIKKVELKED